jgi:cell division protein FtsB
MIRTIFGIIGKFPWWVWVGIFVAVLFAWQSVSGWAYSKKLWNIVMTDIIHDRDSAIETLEQEVEKLNKDKDAIAKKLTAAERNGSVLRAENTRLEGRNAFLEDQFNNLVQPSDPNALVRELQKRGYRIIRIPTGRRSTGS